MRIRRPRNITGVQIGFVTILGVLGGFYIWKPALVEEKENLKIESSNTKTKSS